MDEISLLYRSAQTKANGARAKGCVIVPFGPSESEQYRRLRCQAVFRLSDCLE